jgi:hypothetical protein
MAEMEMIRASLLRQARHWTQAATRLARLDEHASPEAWHRLERYLGVSLRDHLRSVTARLQSQGSALLATVIASSTPAEVAHARQLLLSFRRQYLRAEVTVDFYTDAINTRTNPVLGAKLRACDVLAYRSMATILDPLGHTVPVVLTYTDKGLGASILKAGLRLWDGGSPSVAAAIKIVRHNLERPTSLIHEAGHQVAHITGWNEELVEVIERIVPEPVSARLWSGWASEIAADAVAFVHTGFGSVLALHDVLADVPFQVFSIIPGDPHPCAWLRVLLGVEMCRQSWGAGDWDAFGETWEQLYPLSLAPPATAAALDTARRYIPSVATATLATPMRAFGGRRLVDLASPDRVSPIALRALEARLGSALFTSSHWIWTESLRLLAIISLRGGDVVPAGAGPSAPGDQWLLTLGGAARAA